MSPSINAIRRGCELIPLRIKFNEQWTHMSIMIIKNIMISSTVTLDQKYEGKGVNNCMTVYVVHKTHRSVILDQTYEGKSVK